MDKLIKLAIVDFKLIFRDPSLRTFLVLPALLFVLVVWGVPFFVQKFDFLASYIPLILVLCVVENTQMFSFISGMVLIDEKENNVAKVYGVVPLSIAQFILSRFMFPYLFTVVLNVILFIVQPFYEISWGTNLVVSLLAALIVPLYVLTLNVIADNRMQGMVYIKALNMLVILPIAAFFVPESFGVLFGILPTYWVFRSVENVIQGSPSGLMLGVGFAVFTVLIWLASRAFAKRHFV